MEQVSKQYIIPFLREDEKPVFRVLVYNAYKYFLKGKCLETDMCNIRPTGMIVLKK